MRLSIIATAAARLAFAAAPAIAAVSDDARCVVAYSALADKATDKTEEAQAGAIAMYYAGRLSLETSGQDLGALLQAAAPPFTEEGIGRAAEQCVQAMGPQMHALSDATKFVDKAMGQN
ncbi:hypothetical protein [Phenylobacterium aquaticum]|uniref:hypothetical protein n=1 Tax=Phenylobacterium aquaticum TaxID=1763816 RepID=UPI001F5E3498|nr:hypothetical protein [Phenylobacterium aquaticum]MCI3133098.1 hypothetical protein [Phenylobacterium aquaticum]